NNHWNDRWNHWDNAHSDWNHWHNYNYGRYGGWYHGFCAAPGFHWNYLWNEYPVAMAFGVTRWGLNTLSYRWGLWGYYNPYYTQPVYVNNQQVVVYDQPLIPDVAVSADGTPLDQAPPSPTADDKFDQARVAFYDQKYDAALSLIDQVLVDLPRDAVVNEFRALCLFALGRYQEAAGTVHAILAVGPGWDWTTLSGMYASTSTYTTQLRKLENVTKSKPDDAASRFLLAYHYLTCGHTDAAVKQLDAVVRLVPQDTVAAQLLKMHSAESTPSEATDVPPPPDLEKSDIPLEKLQKTWTASQDGAQYQLQLTSNDEFVWTYTKGGQSQSAKGAYTVRAKSLAMEPDSGGVMLADIDMEANGNLKFAVIDNGPILEFHQ
ncbi:MAG: hypothetical protein B7Z55_00780, partial [Planctomycetales bacterium 12-60-4]